MLFVCVSVLVFICSATAHNTTEGPCNANETLVSCKAGCPTDYCPTSDSRAVVACDPPYPCNPGCVCKPNYKLLSQDDERCVLTTDCPPVNCTRPNEVWSPSPPPCLQETCDDVDVTPVPCNEFIQSSPRCICKDNYFRNDSGICVSAQECRDINARDYNRKKRDIPECGYNEVLSDSKIVCPPQTCESIYTTYLCESRGDEVGCNCLSGYLRNSSGICIPSEECFQAENCSLPSECIPTCAIPNPNCSYVQEVSFKREACYCKPGFILSEVNGECIKIENCPKQQCGVNGTYSDCGFRCPNQYCPEDDSLLQIACKPGRPCPPGCVCKDNYKRKSREEDDVCVLASDCPPVNCTRPNEVWNPCSQCLAERCEDANTTNCYDPPGSNCDPRCVCVDGYKRNKDDVCVPEKACPGRCPIPIKCRPTCAVPNPKKCSKYKLPANNEDGCQCKKGYILSELDGKCVAIDKCPKMGGCNGDPHAVIKECPLACPSTCEAPEAKPCKKKCAPVGCECESGYILSKTKGKCISPEECPGGNPCGPNGTYVQCKSGCPTDYCPVDDNMGILICEYFPFSPCYSGCICKLSYKRLSTEDPKCIASWECPPVNCTRQNEVWDPSPPACLSEYCEDVDRPPAVCNTLVFNNEPKCVCKENYFRNSSSICISAQECREINASKT
ncbi:multiple epidermal growth factor-like domains protein 6 isoform X2 [Bombyx mori]|uniref:multiple epidermal growth factor-like domains protein 6 isoform X2 n=1 Tax=Bombyx mori TaxID=7091 RepID=UPI002ED33689